MNCPIPVANYEGYKLTTSAGGAQLVDPPNHPNIIWDSKAGITKKGFVVEFKVSLDSINTNRYELVDRFFRRCWLPAACVRGNRSRSALHRPSRRAVPSSRISCRRDRWDRAQLADHCGVVACVPGRRLTTKNLPPRLVLSSPP